MGVGVGEGVGVVSGVGVGVGVGVRVRMDESQMIATLDYHKLLYVPPGVWRRLIYEMLQLKT